MKKAATTLTAIILAISLVSVVGCGEQRTETPHSGYLGEELSAMVGVGDVQEAKRLLDEGADVNARTESGYTPLHWAAKFGYTEAASLLLERGADVNARKEDGSTPLSFAAMEGQTETAELLIERGADVNARTESGSTPLRIAAIGTEGVLGHAETAETAELLRRHGGVE
jgi:hypothetical protein